MSKIELTNNLISGLRNGIGTDPYSYTSNTPDISNTIIASVITKYLLKNTSISFGYTGIIPSTPPAPDPVKSDTLPIIGSCSPPKGDNFNSWIRSLERNIIMGFKCIGPGKLGLRLTVPIPAFVPGLVISQSDMKDAFDSNPDDPQFNSWYTISSAIIDWIGRTGNMGLSVPGMNSLSGSTGLMILKKTTIK